MSPPPPPPRRPHDTAVRTFIDHRFEALKGSGPVGDANPSRDARDAILGFIASKRGEVGELHLRNYLAWLPVAAGRMGDSFLQPQPGVQSVFNDAFPTDTYKFHSRQTIGGLLMGLWRYRLALEGKPFPDQLRLKFGRWKSPYGGSDMLTHEEVARIADATENFRDRAWIWTVYSSGCRPGEIFTLRIGDVIPKDGYIELLVRREKDSEHVPAFVYEEAVPALLAWLKAHPKARDVRAPLWVNLRVGERGQAAGYRAMYKVLEKASRRAGITKPATLYHLRRSRLTELAKDGSISQSVLEKVAGWTAGSRVAKHYVRLSGDDVRAALNRRYQVGDSGPERPPTPARTPRTCGRCETSNTAEANFCLTCGGPLTLAAVGDLRDVEARQERLAELLRKPQVVEFLARQLRAINSR